MAPWETPDQRVRVAPKAPPANEVSAAPQVRPDRRGPTGEKVHQVRWDRWDRWDRRGRSAPKDRAAPKVWLESRDRKGHKGREVCKASKAP